MVNTVSHIKEKQRVEFLNDELGNGFPQLQLNVHMCVVTRINDDPQTQTMSHTVSLTQKVTQ